jgi:serine/threonine-protein kinase
MADINWTSVREEVLKELAVAALPPTLQLPALPHAVTQFVQQANDPKATQKELAAIIETDTGLTLELLKHVNSAFMGLRQKASSAQQALSLLGLRPSTMFLITAGMQAAVRAKKSKFINQACFWNASLQKALFAREVAKLLRADPNLAFSGALLQDYLLPVLTNEKFDEYVNFVKDREKKPANLSDYENELFGWNHAVAGACLAHRWHLPDDLVCCVLYHHHGLKLLAHPQLGRSAAAAVAVSALLPDQLRQQYSGLEQLVLLEKKWTAFNIEAIAAKVDELHAEMGMGVHNDFPLLRRCKPALGADNFNDGTLTVGATAA